MTVPPPRLEIPKALLASHFPNSEFLEPLAKVPGEVTAE